MHQTVRNRKKKARKQCWEHSEKRFSPIYPFRNLLMIYSLIVRINKTGLKQIFSGQKIDTPCYQLTDRWRDKLIGWFEGFEEMTQLGSEGQ